MTVVIGREAETGTQLATGDAPLKAQSPVKRRRVYDGGQADRPQPLHYLRRPAKSWRAFRLCHTHVARDRAIVTNPNCAPERVAIAWSIKATSSEWWMSVGSPRHCHGLLAL